MTKLAADATLFQSTDGYPRPTAPQLFLGAPASPQRTQARKLGVRCSFFFMRAHGAQLKTLAALCDAGTLRAVVDRTFPFDETLEALPYAEEGRAKGKVVITTPIPSG